MNIIKTWLENTNLALSKDYNTELKYENSNTFYKDENSRWYASLPGTNFSKEELEMVSGADTMLDIMTQGDDGIRLWLSDEQIPNTEYVLDLLREDDNIGGGHYMLFDQSQYEFQFVVWLCDVTKHVFGKMPKRIYIKRA